MDELWGKTMMPSCHSGILVSTLTEIIKISPEIYGACSIQDVESEQKGNKAISGYKVRKTGQRLGQKMLRHQLGS